MKKYICILICVFALAAMSFGEINVGNASFDEGLSDAADYGDLYSYDWAPWKSGGSTWLGNGYYSGAPAGDGWYVIPAGATWFQDLSVTFSEGQTVEFSIEVGAYAPQPNDNGYDNWSIFLYDATVDPISILATVSGVLSDEETPMGVWYNKTVSYAATAAEVGHTIGIGFAGDYYTLFDHAAVAEKFTAWGPDPYDGQLGVSRDQVLSWNTAVDPNTGEADPAITAHELYMNDGTGDPNVYFVDTIPATGDAGQYTQGAEWLSRDATYYWRVDEVTDSNTITGNVWEFECVLSIPVIDEAIPADALVYSNEDVVFTVSAVNPFTGDDTGLEYQWHEVGVGPLGGNSPVLEINNAQVGDIGEYYCTVTIVSNSATGDSRSASLDIKRLVGHWKLDETTGTTAVDSSPFGYGYAGTLEGGQTFTSDSVAGQVDNALAFGPTDVMTFGAANIPTPWTAGMWVKKTATGVWSTLLISDSVSLRLEQWPSTGKVGLTRAGVADWTFDYSAPLDEWTHLVFVGTSSGTELYVNGTFVDSMANVIECPMDGLGVSSDDLSADIDDIRVYNHDLDPYVIARMFVDDKPGEVVCVEYPKYDSNTDCIVNLADFAELAAQWMECNSVPDCGP